jgi:hypothetical protein
VYYEPPTRSSAVRQEVRYRTLYRMPDRIRSQSRGVWGFGVAAIITKWMDLGEGQTILDPRWLTHLSNKYTASDVFREGDGINGRRLVDRDLARSNHVSIRDSFGQDESSGVDPILPLETAERLFQLPKLSVLRNKNLRHTILFDLD